METTQKEVRNVLTPEKTKSYVPVPNSVFIDTILENADKRNFELVKEQWQLANFNQIMLGTLTFTGSSPDMGMQVGLLNSYNKAKPATIALGSTVFICTNGCVSADYRLKRRHTLGVWKDLVQLIEIGMNNLEAEYLQTVNIQKVLQQIEFPRRKQAQLLGRIFVEEEILTPVMANTVRNQIIKPEYTDFEPENAWSFYNHCTFALKKAHPTESISRHVKLHQYLTQTFNYTF